MLLVQEGATVIKTVIKAVLVKDGMETLGFSQGTSFTGER